MLRRACYDCHSTENDPSFAAKLAPSYWFPSKDLEAVNFSQWKTYDEGRREKTKQAIADVVRSGDMPPSDYRLFHSDGKLSDQDRAAILAWTAGAPAPAKM